LNEFETIATELGKLQATLGEKSMEMAELTMKIEEYQSLNGETDQERLRIWNEQKAEMTKQKQHLQDRIQEIMLKMEKIAHS